MKKLALVTGVDTSSIATHLLQTKIAAGQKMSQARFTTT